MAYFSEEHKLFRKSVQRFIQREINLFVDRWEAEETFPADELYKKIGNEGFLGLNHLSLYGGLELDFWYTIIWIEELGKIEAGGIPMSITTQTEIATPIIAKYGSSQLKEQYLRSAIMGDFIGAIAITEPEAGSDVSSIATIAHESGDYYIINGRKSYITNGSIADFVITLCRTSSGPSANSMSLIVVPTSSPGFTAEKNYKKLGNLCCDHAELIYENVKVSKEYIIGLENMGYNILLDGFQRERLMLAILACSQAKRILNKAKQYAKDRVVFGQRLLDQQSIAFSLVNLETEVEFLQQMAYHCTDLFINDNECTKEMAMVKLKAGKLLRLVADECLQILGGFGYMEDVQMTRAYRDARAMAIAGGSAETMQHILKKFL